LLHPADRTAWLGVLRAPWCGLSLEELYLLVSADDPAVMAATVPELLETRLPELASEGRLSTQATEAALRVANVCREATASRSAAGSLSLGTWLESVWLALGGGDTATPEQAENLRVLWRTLDGLPESEVDLCGPALDAALKDLYAQPDPAASSEFGVQLMTIHKSKGLEFEMVIVPDLEAREQVSHREMMVWLERGLADEETGGEHVSEFLVAPIQAKGTEAGAAKAWVSKAKREQERQEDKRLLYVAATRAREELHLFARPRFQVDKTTGERKLAAPTGLLNTAWPAIEDEVRARFAAWSATLPAEDHSAMLPSLAAEANPGSPGGVIVPFPAARQLRATRMRRLPEGYAAPALQASLHPGLGAAIGTSLEEADDAAGPLYARTEGGLESRALGTAIHALLEHLGRLRAELPAKEAASAVAGHLPGVVARLRRLGLTRAEAHKLAAKALAEARQSSLHPVGAWILAPHDGALSEARWTGALGAAVAKAGASGIRNLRADRVFQTAEMPPLDECESAAREPDSEPAWWIVDYKTSHAEGMDLSNPGDRSAFLETHRRRHLGQLELYARVLRALHGAAGEPSSRIRAGLFYPRLGLFDFWDI
jgi:ATP-dependent exoDNAse (exonuclease V) beta subunit